MTKIHPDIIIQTESMYIGSPKQELFTVQGLISLTRICAVKSAIACVYTISRWLGLMTPTATPAAAIIGLAARSAILVRLNQRKGL